MKKKFTCFLISVIFTPFLFSQTDSVVLNTWVPSAIAGFNVSQVALSNWTQGGDNSITWTLLGNGGLSYADSNWIFRNTLKISYGQTKLGTQDFRTNDNELYLESVIAKKINWAVDPYFSNTIRTAVTKGFTYDSIPPFETVAFFDPGYVTQSLGFTYEKLKGFNTRLGVAVQEVFTNRNFFYADDPETADIERTKIETGIESVTNGEFEIMENVHAKSLLRLFSRFESMDVWDVRWDNVITGKINSYLNVNVTFLLIYEKAQSPKTQLKETLQLGVTYTIF